jgi:hypothetical protein
LNYIPASCMVGFFVLFILSFPSFYPLAAGCTLKPSHENKVCPSDIGHIL